MPLRSVMPPSFPYQIGAKIEKRGLWIFLFCFQNKTGEMFLLSFVQDEYTERVTVCSLWHSPPSGGGIHPHPST